MLKTVVIPAQKTRVIPAQNPRKSLCSLHLSLSSGVKSSYSRGGESEHSAQNGWRTDDHSAQHWLSIGDIPRVVPSAIRSLLFLIREERSNEAHSLPHNCHTLKTLRRKRGLYPGLFSFLSPGPLLLAHRSAAPGMEYGMYTGYGGWVYPG